MKNLTLLTIVLLTTACYNAQENNDCELCGEVDTCGIRDVCDGDDVVFYDVDDECNATEDRQFCEYGCRDAGPDEDVRCFEACEINNCPTPLPICESTTFLTSYNQSTCVVTDDGGEECIDNVSTRRYCGCVEATDDIDAHCWGDSACDGVTCDKPVERKECLSNDYYNNIILATFDSNSVSKCVESDNEDGYECIDIPSETVECGCVDDEGGKEPYCYTMQHI